MNDAASPSRSNTRDDEPPLKAHLALLAGFLMGAADSVPGVSGGTIALILGVYERFIAALHRLLRLPRLLREPEGRRRVRGAFRLLVPLGIGLVIAYWVGTRLLVGPTGHPGWLLRPETAPLCLAFFFGLVIVSLREPWGRIPRHRPQHLVAACIAAALAYGFTTLPHSSGEPATWTLLYGGALAITVMLLPGVSGSLLLFVLGQYTIVAGAIQDVEPVPLIVFAAGLMIGLATAVPALRALLRHRHDATMAALTGLMAGSLGALWPWREGYEQTAPPVLLVQLATVLGMVAAWGLTRLEHSMRPLPEPDLERR